MGALIRIPLINSDLTEIRITREALSDKYFVDKLYGYTFLLTCQMIYKYKWKDKELVA